MAAILASPLSADLCPFTRFFSDFLHPDGGKLVIGSGSPADLGLLCVLCSLQFVSRSDLPRSPSPNADFFSAVGGSPLLHCPVLSPASLPELDERSEGGPEAEARQLWSRSAVPVLCRACWECSLLATAFQA